MSLENAIRSLNIKHPDRLCIGGEWVAPSSARFIDVVSPITEEAFFKVAEANEADMDRAVAAARRNRFLSQKPSFWTNRQNYLAHAEGQTAATVSMRHLLRGYLANSS